MSPFWVNVQLPPFCTSAPLGANRQTSIAQNSMIWLLGERTKLAGESGKAGRGSERAGWILPAGRGAERGAPERPTGAAAAASGSSGAVVELGWVM